MLEPHPLLRVEKNIRRPQLRSPQREDFGVAGEKRYRENDHDQYFNGLLETPLGECRIFGEDIQRMQPVTRERIALLIENHVQYTFMNIEQIERFYSAFYPKWNKEAYYELMRKLKVAPKQKISRMSCGQRSQDGTGPHSRPKRRFTGTRRFLDRTRPRLPPTLHRVSARIRQSRRKDHLPYLAHHTGHGTAGRRLYHHGLRPHTDSEACKGIARHLHTLYLQNIVARQAPPRPVVIQHGGHTGFCRDLLVRKRRTYQTDIARAIDTLYRFQIRENESGRRFHRIDRKILILLSSEL